MAPTTFRSFIDALESLDITGVVREFHEGPPAGAPATADTPFQYVRYPQSDEIPIVFGEQGGWPSLRAELVVCVEPVAQSTQPRNFDDTVDMMDNIATALREADCLAKSHLTWSLRMTTDLVAGTAYWAVVVNVEGHG